MEKQNKQTDGQILDHIVSLYLEKHPRVEKYSITLTSENGQQSFYWPLSEEVKAMVREWSTDKEGYGTLQDYLSEQEGGQEIIEQWLDVWSPFELDTVESCDLNDSAKATTVCIHVLDKDVIDNEGFYHSVLMDDVSFRQILKFFITRCNTVTMNMLAYLMPEYTSEMMKYLVETLNDGVCAFTKPFCVEMTEISNITDIIMNPLKDELRLFENADEEIHNFMVKYAIVPSSIDLFEERVENEYYYHVYTNFSGNTLNIEQERLVFNDSWFPSYEDEDSLNLKANELCKHLGLHSYDELLEYFKVHFNTRSALKDIHEFVKADCPNALCDK